MRRLAFVLVVLGGCWYDLTGYSDGAPLALPGGDASTADTSTGDASTDAASDVRGDASFGCPGTGGPTPVRAGGFCIDSTEVTKEHYAAFLAAKLSDASGQPAYCSWNGSYVPSCSWPITGDKDDPVRCVDWCDAYAFCAWAGKRLCGKVGGGALPAALRGTASDQWHSACSQAGTNAYPYGGTYDPNACNGADRHANTVVPAGSLPTCTGGVAGLFDMSGNVTEWVDSCDEDVGPDDMCIMQNGSYGDESANLGCGRTFMVARQGGAQAQRGFRCCSP